MKQKEAKQRVSDRETCARMKENTRSNRCYVKPKRLTLRSKSTSVGGICYSELDEKEKTQKEEGEEEVEL